MGGVRPTVLILFLSSPAVPSSLHRTWAGCPYLYRISDRTHFIFLSSAVIFLYKDLGLMVTNIGSHWSTLLLLMLNIQLYTLQGRDTTSSQSSSSYIKQLENSLIMENLTCVLFIFVPSTATVIHRRENIISFDLYYLYFICTYLVFFYIHIIFWEQNR